MDEANIFHQKKLRVYKMEYYSYIQPLYLNVLSGNFLGGNCKNVDAFIESTKLAIDKLTDRDFIQMYSSGNWRELITASWLQHFLMLCNTISKGINIIF